MSEEIAPQAEESHTKLLGWPTDILSIDFLDPTADDGKPKKDKPHTILIMVPGNPGQYNWYLSDLVNLVQRLGHGYAARSLSHAGHSLGGKEGIVDVENYARRHGDADPSIPWTIQGQVRHKSAFIDLIMADWNDNQKPGQQRNEYKDKQPKFIFLGHSFGCYVIQQLCIQRRDILDQTIGFLHLMPFIRMKADCFHQHKLDLWANNPGALIALGTAASRIYKALPMPWVDALVKMGIHADKTRDIALKILREPRFVKNFFMLGTEEIRDIPREVDIKPLFIAKDKPLFMLFAGKDQWAPRFHMAEIARLQAKSMLPPNIFMTYLPELRHDYVSFHGMSPIVVAWCAQCISSVAMRPHASSFVPLERELLSKL